MKRLFFIQLFVVLALSNRVNILNDQFFKDTAAASGTFRAGVSKVDATLPIGTPLAGYNHGTRKAPYFPLPEFGEYTTFMMPSQGVMDPTWVRGLALDNGVIQLMFVTTDAIGSDQNMNKLAWELAVGMGFPIPFENCLFSSSHSHSGPGAISSDFLWSIAPATDLFVPSLQHQFANSTANAMMEAYNNLESAAIDIGMGWLPYPATKNRRADISKYVKPWTVDANLGVIRVDDASGNPLATLWNFAVHSDCYGPDNMLFSGDITGKTNEFIEESIGGIALFVNGDAGDIDPGPTACNNAPQFSGATVFAQAVKQVHGTLNPTNVNITMMAAADIVDFGPTDLNATLQRFDNCTKGGAIDICSVCTFLQCDFNAHMPEAWLQNTPTFTAFGFVINGKSTVTVSIPGEALIELGWWIRNDTQAMGFDQTFLTGYSNSHMGYFATPDEYDIGGYESQMTFWGIDTAHLVREGCKGVAQQVIPK